MSESEKVNLYIDLSNISDRTNKTKAVTTALKLAYDNKDDFISFVRLHYMQDKEVEFTSDINNLISGNKLKYNTLIKMDGISCFIAKGTSVVLTGNTLEIPDDFMINISKKFHVKFYEHVNEFNFDTVCAQIICEGD